MKKNIFTGLLSLMFVLGVSQVHALALGEKIPDTKTKMKGVDGKTHTIKDVKGKSGTLVIFTCNHCPFVKAWFDRTVALGNEYAKKGVGIIAINANDPKASPEDGFDQMKALAKGTIEYPYVVDETSNVAKSFGATKTPEFYLFDAKDTLVYQGALDSDSRNPAKAKPFLKAALTELLDGKKISVAETKSMGCGIKFRPIN